MSPRPTLATISHDSFRAHSGGDRRPLVAHDPQEEDEPEAPPDEGRPHWLPSRPIGPQGRDPAGDRRHAWARRAMERYDRASFRSCAGRTEEERARGRFWRAGWARLWFALDEELRDYAAGLRES